MVKKDMISKNWQGSDKARKRLQNRIDQYKKDRIKLDNLTTNKNKIRKNKSTPLIISIIFFDQYQFTATQIDLNHSNISDENSVKVMKLPIEFFNECHE
jgi:hypothetical protein